MPPWPADPHLRQVLERSLVEQSRNRYHGRLGRLRALKEGNPPMRRSRANGWMAGIFPSPMRSWKCRNAFNMPASGEVEYQYIVVPTGFTEDKWVTQVEIRPSDRTVVHHAVIFIREPGHNWLTDAKPGVPFVPGPGERRAAVSEYRRARATTCSRSTRRAWFPMSGSPARPSRSRRAATSSSRCTTPPAARPGNDHTRIGLVFAKEPPKERIITLGALNNRFTIPRRRWKFQGRSRSRPSRTT